MGYIRWDFPLLGTASLSGSNNAAITMFKGTGVMDGLAREICKNSLDAKNKKKKKKPVKMKFELIHLNKSRYPIAGVCLRQIVKVVAHRADANQLDIVFSRRCTDDRKVDQKIRCSIK